jgi:phospholipase/lecithinase/hemolysin
MSGTTSTSPFSTIYAFGDSLSDAGNVSILTALTGEEPVSPPYYHTNYGVEQGTVFSNGPVWVQDLSEDLGLGQLAPSLAGGTDFAYGGAETGSTPQNSGNSETALLSLPNQLSQFKTEVGRASSSALFTLSIGGNDIIDILAGAGNTAQQQSIDVTDSVNNEISAINQMASDGMKCPTWASSRTSPPDTTTAATRHRPASTRWRRCCRRNTTRSSRRDWRRRRRTTVFPITSSMSTV